MKKYVKAIIVVHILMVAALLSTGFFEIAIGTMVFASAEFVTEVITGAGVAFLVTDEAAALISANAEGIKDGTAESYVVTGALDAFAAYGAMAIPVIGPVLAALEYFDVTDFVDWF